MPIYCEGTLRGHTCRASRKRDGKRATISGPCDRCGEKKCRKHCACGRNGTATGRNAARGSRPQVQVPVVTSPTTMQPLPETVVTRPAGRPPPLSLRMMTEQDLFDELLPAVKTAGAVVAATFLYDDPALHSMFLTRLGGRSSFDLTLFVDKQGSSGGICRHMRPRLRELVRAGAAVWLCDGHSHNLTYGSASSRLVGHLHVKGLVLDRQMAFSGSMNLTRSARTNKEVMFRMTGPIVEEFLAHLLTFREGAEQML